MAPFFEPHRNNKFEADTTCCPRQPRVFVELDIQPRKSTKAETPPSNKAYRQARLRGVIRSVGDAHTVPRKRLSVRILLVLRAVDHREMRLRHHRGAYLSVVRQMVWSPEHSSPLVLLSSNSSSIDVHFFAKCPTVRSSRSAARQPKAKPHGIQQSESLAVTQHAVPLFPRSSENQNR